MKEIFLSASVPEPGRGHFHESSDPFLIQTAVRELVVSVIRDYRIVWGGHPSITPMLWSICKDLGAEYPDSVTLYQSGFFRDQFPEENHQFKNVEVVEAIANDRDASLQAMREAMISRPEIIAAVFVGGMAGVLDEYKIFKAHHPADKVISLGAPGGAALDLANTIARENSELFSLNFAKLFGKEFPSKRKPSTRSIQPL